MKSYIKRLNWNGFFIILLLTAFGAASRTQDASIYDSFMVWLIIGVPVSLVFLFIGMDKKNKHD